jgi:hypothetical protein
MSVDILRDLRSEFGPARDQDQRPTCSAFAASDTHAGLRSGWDPLSAEWAYYHAVRRDGGKPDDGATLGSMLKALELDGQPHESGWPYIANPIIDVAAWKPPAGVATLFRRDGNLMTATLDEIINRVDGGVPVLMSISVSDAFYLPGKDGVIDSAEKPDPTRRHAVVAVGHGVRASERMILIRNSWGADWGIEGYGWLTETYLTPRLRRAAILTKDL